jgi:replication factor C subunit 2/4
MITAAPHSVVPSFVNTPLFIKKYQPYYFDDFEMDPNFRSFLESFLHMPTINLIFLGNIGSGKSSMLSAFLREYYCLKKDVNVENLDNVLYINSLKEQGINYYRNDVKTFCQTPSIVLKKKKIIVLDDIDLMNEQSQQVFRNCIDKYGHNVHFIASCSNIHKVNESLQSRFHLIHLASLTNDNICTIMKKIQKAENIDIEPDAISFVLEICENTAKTLILYMEKFKLVDETITMDLAIQLCTNISFHSMTQYTEFLLQGNLYESIRFIYDLYDKGYSVMDILDNYFLYVKKTNLLTEDQKYKIIPYICKYITVFHNIHEDEIELALFTNNVISALHCVQKKNV